MDCFDRSNAMKCLLIVSMLVLFNSGAGCYSTTKPKSGNKDESDGGASFEEEGGEGGEEGEGGGSSPDTEYHGGDDTNSGSPDRDESGDEDAEVNQIVVLPWEDSEEKEERIDLIRNFCALREYYPCIEFEFDQLDDYSREWTVEEIVEHCEARNEIDYNDMVDMDCREEWEAAINCVTQIEYHCPCEGFYCRGVPIYTAVGYAEGDCWQEGAALRNCTDRFSEERSIEITGDRDRCYGNPGENHQGSCWITCGNTRNVQGEDRYFSASCYGAPEASMMCECRLNWMPMIDSYGVPTAFPAKSCLEAVQRVADGECMRHVDCCFTWFDEEGNEDCTCTAAPERSTTGAKTCEGLASALGGEVVSLCPRYVNPLGANPP